MTTAGFRRLCEVSGLVLGDQHCAVNWYAHQWLPWAGGPAWDNPHYVAHPIGPNDGLHQFYWPRVPESVPGMTTFGKK